MDRFGSRWPIVNMAQTALGRALRNVSCYCRNESVTNARQGLNISGAFGIITERGADLVN